MWNSWIRPIRFIDFNNIVQHTPLGLIHTVYQLACTPFWRGFLIVLMQESKGLKNLKDLFFFSPNLDTQRSFLLDPSETAGINIPSGCPWSATTDKRGCCYQPSALKWQNSDSELQIFFFSCVKIIYSSLKQVQYTDVFWDMNDVCWVRSSEWTINAKKNLGKQRNDCISSTQAASRLMKWRCAHAYHITVDLCVCYRVTTASSCTSCRSIQSQRLRRRRGVWTCFMKISRRRSKIITVFEK